MKKSNLFIVLAIVVGIIGILFNVKLANADEQTIKVGVYNMPGFCNVDVSGEVSGYNIDFLNEIARVTNWKYEYVIVDSFSDGMEKMKSKNIDLLAPCQITKEREETYDFSEYPIGTEYTALVALKNNSNYYYEDYGCFNGMTVAATKNYLITDYFVTYMQKHNFNVNMKYYNTPEEALAAMRDKKVDAAVANLMEVDISNDKVLARFEPKPFYYMTWKGNESMLESLNQALAGIQTNRPSYLSDLVSKYFPVYDLEYLTEEEHDFAVSLDKINVGYIANRKPVSYTDENTGELAGFSREVFDKIQKLTGLQFNYVALPDGKINYNYLKENDIRLVTGVEYNEVNTLKTGMNISNPYLSMNKVLIGDKDIEFDRNAKLTLAINTGSQTVDQAIKQDYKNFEIVKYNSVKECFDAVDKGDADVLIINQYTADYYLSMAIYENLEIIPTEEIDDMLCFGTIGNDDDCEMLINIINKSITMFTNNEISNIIINETENTKYEYTINDFIYKYRYVLIPLIITIIAIIILSFTTYFLRKRNYNIIKHEEKKLRSITNNINGGVMVLIPQKGFLIKYANEGLFSILGYDSRSVNEVVGKQYITYVHPDDIEKLKQLEINEYELEKKVSFKLRMEKRDGDYIETLFSGTMMKSSKGEINLYCVIMDISEQIELQEKVSMQQKRYEIILEKSEDIIYEVNIINGVINESDSMAGKFGWNFGNSFDYEHEINFEEFWHVHKEDLNKLSKAYDVVVHDKKQSECVVRLSNLDGEYIWCKIYRYPIMDHNGEVVSIVGKIEDVNDTVLEKEILTEKSRLDTMTGLINKDTFKLEVEEIIKSGKVENAALVFIDLDYFKKVNDTLGHITGDKAIKDAAKKLQVIFANSDYVSRFGGDEFCIFLKEIPMNTLEDKLTWAVQKLAQKYEVGDKEVEVTASIGAVYYDEVNDEFKVMLDKADKAVYRAKEEGRNRYIII